LFKYIDV
jgi:hypothetical protein